MTQTPQLKLTIPDPTGEDDLGDWPTIAGQGFLDLENSLILPVDSRTPSDDFTKFPNGMSLMGVSATAASWPGGVYGALLTMRRAGGTFLHQLYMSGDIPAKPFIYYRSGSSVSGFTPWLRVAASGILPSAMATGAVTINGAAGVRSAIVMFPANRFTTAPRVQVSNCATGRPDLQIGCSSDGTSATQFTAYVHRTDSNPASLNWTATEGVE